jgi:hypothetical protein
MLDRSSLIFDFLQGVGTNLVFEVNGNMYPYYYLLVNGIDPQWFIFVQTVHKPQGEKQ